MSFAKSSALSARFTIPARVAAASLVLLSALPAQNPATTPRPADSTGSALDAVPAAEPPQLVKPTDEELSLSFLRQPGEKARAAFDAYKGGKFDEARKQSEALAAAGDANGMFLLALCHQFGRGGQPSLPEAEKWLREAAAKGHDAARTNLGLLLYSTHSNDKDRLAEAVRVLREASTNDGARAGMVLGELYARGVGATADFAEADRYFDMAIKAGQLRGWFARGLLHGGAFGFEKQKNSAKSDEFFKRGADAGLVEAMVALGQRKVAESKGEGPLLTVGLQWIEKAADKGTGEACVVLGAIYEEGRLVKKDLDKAVAWFRKGADLGYPQALTKLGHCYENGLGVEKDAKKAFENYKAAADRGYAAAIFNVAVCYDNGVGVEKSPAMAFRHYIASARAGLALAMNETAVRYQSGQGTLEDVVAAGAWLSLAAQSGNVPAQVNLARLYLQGLGVPRNIQTAVQLYSAAANAGHPIAAFELAQLCESGVEISRDPVKAHALFDMAADFKTEKAAERRDSLARELNKDQLTAAELVRKGLPAPAEAAPAESAANRPGEKASKPAAEPRKDPAKKR